MQPVGMNDYIIIGEGNQGAGGMANSRIAGDTETVQFASPAQPGLEFGIIRGDHELVPSHYQTQPSGVYLTFVVPNVDEIYEKAVAAGLTILQPPQDEFYGQRRFLTEDPNGCLVDICSPVG